MATKAKINLYEGMKKYKVEACSLEEFCKKYYKHGAYEGRGKDYATHCLQSQKRYVDKYGYAFITRHDSTVGQHVTWYPNKAGI